MASISEQYLEALVEHGGWVTVAEWAQLVANKFPELLEKANKEALNHKKPTTGIREIAARIGSWVSTGGFEGRIEVDQSERPKRVRPLSIEEQKRFEEVELASIEESITRTEKIESDEASLSQMERYRADEFDSIAILFRDYFKIDLEVDHAKALLNAEQPGKHHPDNLQLLQKRHNSIKNDKNWPRFSIDEQIQYLKALVQVQRLLAEKLVIQVDDKVLETIFSRLKAIF